MEEELQPGHASPQLVEHWVSKDERVSQQLFQLMGSLLLHVQLPVLQCDVYLGRSKTLRLTGAPNLNPKEDLKCGTIGGLLGLGDYGSVYAPSGFFGAVRVPEYVVYQPHQAIPKFLIEFEREK